MCDRAGEVDMPHAFTTHFGLGYFNAAFFANHATMLEALVFSAQALIVLDRAKNFGAEQTVTLWLESTVVDGFRFFDFAVRP